MSANTGFWAIDYAPTFKNCCMSKHLKKKLKNILDEKCVPFNLYFVGIDGIGKNTIVKTILNHCFNIKYECFKEHNTLENTIYYDSIYVFDFLNTTQTNSKEILEFISKFAIRNVFYNHQKIIILRHIEHLEKFDLVKQVKYIIGKFSKYVVFIASSNKLYPTLQGLCCMLRVPKLDNKEFKSLVNSLYNTYTVDFNNNKIKSKTDINYNVLYKIYRDSRYNLKDFVVWYQYHITVDTENPKMMIKNKIIASLVKNIFISNYHLNNFELIREKLLNTISMGFTDSDILQMMIKMILINKSIDSKTKHKIVNIAAEVSEKMGDMDRTVFALENILFKIYIYFNENRK